MSLFRSSEEEPKFMRRRGLIVQAAGWWDAIQQWLPVVLLVLVVLVPLGLLLWLALFTDTFRIQAVTVVDARPHTLEAVQSLVKDAHDRHIFFIQTDILEQKVLSEVPQVRTVHIARKLPATLKVVVQEKSPRLLLLSNGKYYFVDQDGIAYEESRLDTLPGIVLPVVKNNDATARLTIGTAVVEKNFVQFVDEITSKVTELFDVQVVEMRIPSLSAREVHVLLDNNWEIRFDSTRSAAIQAGVLDKLVHGTITEEEKATLEYVDLRIPNRVYYRTVGSVE